MNKRCKITTRRCSVSKKCLSKSSKKRPRCKTGSRKCSDSKCYRKNKSKKSRRHYMMKFGNK